VYEKKLNPTSATPLITLMYVCVGGVSVAPLKKRCLYNTISPLFNLLTPLIHCYAYLHIRRKNVCKFEMDGLFSARERGHTKPIKRNVNIMAQDTKESRFIKHLQ
jgi:hypothetical protein